MSNGTPEANGKQIEGDQIGENPFPLHATLSLIEQLANNRAEKFRLYEECTRKFWSALDSAALATLMSALPSSNLGAILDAVVVDYNDYYDQLGETGRSRITLSGQEAVNLESSSNLHTEPVIFSFRDRNFEIFLFPQFSENDVSSITVCYQQKYKHTGGGL